MKSSETSKQQVDDGTPERGEVVSYVVDPCACAESQAAAIENDPELAAKSRVLSLFLDAPVPSRSEAIRGTTGDRATGKVVKCRWDVCRTWYLPVKAVLDVIMAALLLPVVIPIITVAALVMKLTSRGPAFYRQARVGKDGQIFNLLKLRTMMNNAEVCSGRMWSMANDPRVPPFGRFLRATHIDELPQLVNVLLGQMSLVGPRPERPEMMSLLKDKLPVYAMRLKVRPGITGLAQINLPPDPDPECVRRQLVHDLFYVHHVNPWLDARILARTASKLSWALACSVVLFVSPPTSDDIEGHAANYSKEFDP